MLADSQKLANKWQDSGLLEGIEDNRVKNNMAMILENQAKQIVAEANVTGTGGTFTAGEGEQWAGVALPLVRKVFAQIVAQDFVSVQPMNLPSGLVFYLDFKYGSNLSGRSAGDNMYGNVSSASNKMSVDEEVSGGLYGAGQFGYSMKSASVTFQDDTGSATSASIAYNDDLNVDHFITATKSLSNLSLFQKVSFHFEEDAYARVNMMFAVGLMFHVVTLNGDPCIHTAPQYPSVVTFLTLRFIPIFLASL